MKTFLVFVSLVVLTLAGASVSKASPLTFVTFLTGPSESPPNASPGTGVGMVIIDPTTHMMTVSVTFSGLLGNTTASHIHGPTAVPFTGIAGVTTTTPTFPGFPLGVTSGTYSMTFDMTLASSYNPAFITANGGSIATSEAVLFSAIMDGRAYLNIHTNLFQGGEIRGFLVAVPEPATLLLLGTGLGTLGLKKLRNRKRTTV